MIGLEATCLLLAFKGKTRQTKELAVHGFTKSVGLTHRSATHTVQKHFMEMEATTKDFIAMAKVKIRERNLDDILNMDQMPIPYSFHSNKTLDMKGKKTIHARASTMDTKHVTIATTITASVRVLAPFLIFKRRPSGQILMHEFSTYPNAGKYACQEKVWMDEKKMHEWIDVVLKP